MNSRKMCTKAKKEMEEVIKWESKRFQQSYRIMELELGLESNISTLLIARKWEGLHESDLTRVEEEEAYFYERYAGDEALLQRLLSDVREQKERTKNILRQTRKQIRGIESRQKVANDELDAITNAELSSNHKSAETAATSIAADPEPVKTPAEHVPKEATLSTSVTGQSPSAPLPSDHQKFEEQMNEKKADLKKQMAAIENVKNKMNELMQKLHDAGYLQADNQMLRTDLTVADRLVADPMMATYEKYVILILTQTPNDQQLVTNFHPDF